MRLNAVTPKIAYYARYSCDQQRDTSIEDQLRRCREVAAQHGLPTEGQVFQDEALSGTSKHNHKRLGYKALLAAWDGGQFSVLIVDEFSRLTRDGLEQARLIKRLEENRRVRLITANGTDTQVPNWQLTLGLMGLVGQQAIRDTRDRVMRGMVGQLERGYMIAAPAYGYRSVRDLDERQNSKGTHWVINQPEAEIVREIFARRAAGEPMTKIAKSLNDRAVPMSREPETTGGGFWRSARIRAILAHPIYRGEYRWHGSGTYQAMARKIGKAIEEEIFAREDLRLVTDEIWHRCNDQFGTRSGYSSSKNVLAGIVRCGCCGGILAVSAAKGDQCRSLYCPSCSLAKTLAGQDKRLSSTIATDGVQFLLTEAMKMLLTAPFLEAFKDALRQRLAGDGSRDIELARAELARLAQVRTRLLRMIDGDEAEDPMLEQRYKESRDKVRDAEVRLKELEAGQAIDPEAIEAQLEADPGELIATLFDAGLPPYQLRTQLGHLFPSIVFEGKDSRYVSRFTLRFAPGAALALASGTEVLSDEGVELRFYLRYSRPVGPAREDHGNYWRAWLAQPSALQAEPPATWPVVDDAGCPQDEACAVAA